MTNLVPDEVWLKLLSHLDSFNTIQFGATCHRFNALTKDPSLWEKLEIDVANINENLNSVKAIIDTATKLKKMKITNKKEEKINDAVIASLVVKAKNTLKVLIINDEIKLKNKAIIKFECLSEMETLNFRSDIMTAAGLKAIGNLKKLKKLKIPGNENSYCRYSMEEEFNKLVIECPNLQCLNLGSWFLTDENLKNIAKNCSNLRDLNLDSCMGFGDDGLYALSQLRKLHKLTLAYTTVSDQALQIIAKSCTKLSHLNIAECVQVKNQGLETLAKNCLELEHLNLMGCYRLNEDSFKAVANFKKLKHLDLTGHHFMTDDSLQMIAKNCSQLRYLDLSFCYGIRDAGVKDLAENCPSLRHLNLDKCIGLKKDGMKALAANCLDLQYLNISGCARIDEEGFNAIASFKNLQHLDLTNLSNVTDNNLVNIGTNCGQLLRLHLSWCHGVGSDGLKALSKSCLDLQHLKLVGFKDLKNDHFNAIHGFKTLLYLDMTGCSKVNETVVNNIAKNCNELKNLKVTIPFSGPASRKKRLRKQLLDKLKKKHGRLAVDVDCHE